jgi:sec-independent protein translocase protein TatB
VLDFGFDKIALIGAVALIVIGPEKLPRVARTVGTLLGKAQRYVADVKAEVNRSIELEELQKMKTQFQTAVSDVEQSVRQEVDSATQALNQTWSDVTSDGSDHSHTIGLPPPEYERPAVTPWPAPDAGTAPVSESAPNSAEAKPGEAKGSAGAPGE